MGKANGKAESTFQKLFAAQAPSSSQSVLFNHARPSSAPTSALPRPTSVSSTRSAKSTQRSLHAFWSIPSQPQQGWIEESSMPPISAFSATKCEDCDILLPDLHECAMDMDVDVGYASGGVGGGYGCQQCSRQVCGGCAVVSSDETRSCLQCKTSRKAWVGGVGWASVG